MSRPDGWRPPRHTAQAARGEARGVVVMLRRDKLLDRLTEARRAWEELDSTATSYAMRKAAENRYLTLKRLATTQ